MKEIKVTNKIFSLEGFQNGSRAIIVSAGDGCVLINPPAADSAAYQRLFLKYPVKEVYISDRNYAAQGYALRMDFKIPFGAHHLESEFLKYPANFTFQDGQELLCGVRVIHLKFQRMRGESAFHLSSDHVLIAGDVLRAHEAGHFKMAAEHEYEDHKKAQAGLRRLFSLKFETYLPASGAIILSRANEKLDKMFDELQ